MKQDVAIVITTVCRDSLLRAVRSVYAQNYAGQVQVLVGVDHDPGRRGEFLKAQLEGERPHNMLLTWIDPGYSTSIRHGGVHSSFFGGAMRPALTLLANAEIVIYLDDDDWLHPDHLAQIVKAIESKAWAYSYSVYADGNSGTPLCVDEIESVGVDRGIYRDQFGGFVRPSGLALNKLKLLPLIHLWACSPFATGDGEDRLMFDRIRREPHGCTGNATVYCAIDPKDGMHAARLAFMKSKGVQFTAQSKTDSMR